MESDNMPKFSGLKLPVVVVLILLLLAGLAGWWLAKSNHEKNSSSPNSQASNDNALSDVADPSAPNIRSLVSYKLPAGWKENTCPAKNEIYIAPKAASVNCEMDPRAPVIISFDSVGATDCNQLQNVQNVSKHVCISEYINGKKSLKAETIYNKESIYGKETAINSYYIDTGNGVVKVEYVHDSGEGEYLDDFEQLAKSIQVKA